MRLAVIAYRKWNFRVMGVSRALLGSELLERDAYVQLPRGVENDNVSWKQLKPLYGLSTAGKYWDKTYEIF